MGEAEGYWASESLYKSPAVHQGEKVLSDKLLSECLKQQKPIVEEKKQEELIMEIYACTIGR